MKTILLLLGLIITNFVVAQQFTETITKEYTLEKRSADNTVMVANINGDVKVTGYAGENIILEIKRSITAKTEARLEKGKQELKYGLIDKADTLIFYVAEGCNSFGQRKGNQKNGITFKNGWGYEWNCLNDNCRKEYDYRMDFTLKVPAGIHVMVSTINDGDLVVENVKGSVYARNINGSVKLVNLVREADAKSINGDLDVEYASNPSKDCSFYTLNGDINAIFPKGLTARMNFESFNGEFYTNVQSIEALPVNVVTIPQGAGIKYKVNGNRYQLGKGSGPYLDFETFNGNVYLKEKN